MQIGKNHKQNIETFNAIFSSVKNNLFNVKVVFE